MEHAIRATSLAFSLLFVACGGSDDPDASVRPDASGADTSVVDVSRGDIVAPDVRSTDAQSPDASSTDASGTDASGTDASSTDTGGSDATTPPPSCNRQAPVAASRARRVVVSFPYTPAGMRASEFAVMNYSAAGALAAPGTRFTMGRAVDGEIVFTPDGQIGLVAQEDGTIGVVRFDAGGVPTVVHAGFRGTGRAKRLVMDPAGDVVYVLDIQFRMSGGGVYRVRVGCDGTLTDEGLVTAARLPYALLQLPADPSRAVLASRDVLVSTPGHDAHVVTLGPPLGLVGGADAFGHDEAIIAGAAITPDGRYALLGDNNGFATTGNRVAAVEVLPTGLRAAQVLMGVQDPIAIVASPFGNAAIVVSGFGNAILRLGYDPGSASAPFALRGPLTYMGGRPQLPGSAVQVTVGSLRGRVLVAENLGVRQLQFNPDGTVTDLGRTPTGTGTESVVGALGVQP